MEWGDGLAEGLSDAPLVVRITRDSATADAEVRVVEFDPLGARWLGVDLA